MTGHVEIQKINKQISSHHHDIICTKIWNNFYHTENSLDQLVFLTSSFTLSARDVVSLMIQMSTFIISLRIALSLVSEIVGEEKKPRLSENGGSSFVPS